MIFIFKEERIFEIYDTVIFGLIRDFEYNLFISSSTKHMLASGVTRTLSNIFLILLVIKEGKKDPVYCRAETVGSQAHASWNIISYMCAVAVADASRRCHHARIEKDYVNKICNDHIPLIITEWGNIPFC